MKKSITTVKQAFESQSVIITKIMQGHRKNVRIDARTRFHVADQDNYFSKWVSEDYANKLCRENYGKELSEMSVFSY